MARRYAIPGRAGGPLIQGFFSDALARVRSWLSCKSFLCHRRHPNNIGKPPNPALLGGNLTVELESDIDAHPCFDLLYFDNRGDGLDNELDSRIKLQPKARIGIAPCVACGDHSNYT